MSVAETVLESEFEFTLDYSGLLACCRGVEVAGWTADGEILVQYPA